MVLRSDMKEKRDINSHCFYKTRHMTTSFLTSAMRKRQHRFTPINWFYGQGAGRTAGSTVASRIAKHFTRIPMHFFTYSETFSCALRNKFLRVTHIIFRVSREDAGRSSRATDRTGRTVAFTDRVLVERAVLPTGWW